MNNAGFWKFRVRQALIAHILFALLASTAQAGIITFTGDTTGGPTFNRLLEDLSAPSSVGTAVAYSAFNFSVTANGNYTFLSTATFDSFGFLYQSAFDPTTPSANALAGNDDLLGLTTSGFAHDLTAGTNYVYVNTGFGNSDFGVFSSTLGGPGTFVGIPGPSVATDIVDFTGTTTGGPTFNRPLEDLSAASVIGTAVAYDVFNFSVTENGTYTFLITAIFDSFALLYEDSFNPASPLTNALAGNDDLLGLTTSGFAHDLTVGTNYVFVSTGFGNLDFGAFSDTVGGPGALVAASPHPVPEPHTGFLLGLGLVAVGLVRRRRSLAILIS